MHNPPVISVIIDSYNYGNYIEDAINSVLVQTLPRNMFEVIVVDDGSTDDTRQRVSKYLPGVEYIYKENGGQASAFNAGVAVAQGEYIAFLDADDYWYPNKLAMILEKFESDGQIDVVYHTLTIVNGENEHVEIFPKWFNEIVADNPVQNYADWLSVIGSATSGLSFRMATLRQLFPIPEEFTLCADGYLMVVAPLVSTRFGLIDCPLGYYRIHGANGFGGLTKEGNAYAVKSRELAMFYNKMFEDKFDTLVATLGKGKYCLPRAVCLMDELLVAREERGVVAALNLFWTKRKALANLPARYMCHRIGAILLRLILSEKLFMHFREVYHNSRLWKFLKICPPC